MTRAVRNIVTIDEDKCDGCGLCVPSCAEGAIRIVDGKAKLVAENLCDGIGNCLGECPKGAITIEPREVDAFDETAVETHLRKPEPPRPFTGCPGTKLRMMTDADAGATEAGPEAQPKVRINPNTAPGALPPSGLAHWPVQLALLPETGPLWDGADVVLAADCAAFALNGFHEQVLGRRKTLAIACPKLDDTAPYVEKLARVFAANDVARVTVVRMEVPCCMGLTAVAQQALERAGRSDIAFRERVVKVDGSAISSADRAR